MERRIIGRGLLAGALAGVLAFLYARVFIEPVIGRAIDYESGRADAHAAMTGMSGHDMELFTRDVQSWAGMGFGVLAFSVAMAGLFALAFTMLYPRTCKLSARMTSALLAAGAFVTVYLVPFLKYPANPPSIGEADTIKERTGLYLLMLVLSVALALGAVWLGGRLAPKLGTWGATLSAIGGYVVAVGVVMWVLPAIDETPQPKVEKSGMILYPGFPADDLYQFRLHALGAQIVIWATIGLVFGTLVSRLLEDQRRQPLSV
ncbi:MAG: CbtA family protein [Mycobacterium sp.]